MKTLLSLFVVLFIATPAPAKPWKTLIKFAEHAALGAGVGAGTAYAAGGPQKYWAGLAATSGVAGFKEGSDAINYVPARIECDATTLICTDTKQKGDTKKMAFLHGIEILSGEITFVLIKHSNGVNPTNPLQPGHEFWHHR